MIHSILKGVYVAIATVAFGSPIMANVDPELEHRVYTCGENEIAVDTYTGNWGCILWLPEGGYIYGPRCDSSVNSEKPWSDFGVVFNDDGTLVAYADDSCVPK